jgi:hypothetical protein
MDLSGASRNDPRLPVKVQAAHTTIITDGSTWAISGGFDKEVICQDITLSMRSDLTL